MTRMNEIRIVKIQQGLWRTWWTGVETGRTCTADGFDRWSCSASGLNYPRLALLAPSGAWYQHANMKNRIEQLKIYWKHPVGSRNNFKYHATWQPEGFRLTTYVVADSQLSGSCFWFTCNRMKCNSFPASISVCSAAHPLSLVHNATSQGIALAD